MDHERGSSIGADIVCNAIYVFAVTVFEPAAGDQRHSDSEALRGPHRPGDLSEAELPPLEEIQYLVNFVKNSKRGISK